MATLLALGGGEELDASVFLCGDVMLGRGVDQILPHPLEPSLREPYVRDARMYVELAEEVNGPIPRPVDFSWPWGDALDVLSGADVRVLNLETSVTGSARFAAQKRIHYRMSPANLPCLSVGRPDACVLANNHVLDFGREGLAETLDALSGAGLAAVGAGRDIAQAWRPVVVPVEGRGRVLVFSFGMPSSGIPRNWAATGEAPGIAVVHDLTDAAADEVVEQVRRHKVAGDIAVVSIHWGSNWGFPVPQEQIDFAHRLVDGGVDVVHGHSSHHPRPVEVYRGKLILHGCGDFIDDYEGIGGHEEYRDELRLGYVASIDPDSGTLAGLRMTPLRARKLRLQRASPEDAEWLRSVLDDISRGLGTRIGLEPDGRLAVVAITRPP